MPKNKASIFQENIKTELTNLGEIQQVEKELDKNVLEIKALVKKWEIHQKFCLNNKTFFGKMKAIILTTHSIQN